MKLSSILFILLLAGLTSSQNLPPYYTCPSPTFTLGDNWCCYYDAEQYNVSMPSFTANCTSTTWKKFDEMCCTKFYNINYIISSASDNSGIEYTTYKSPYDGSITAVKQNVIIDYNPQALNRIDTQTSTQTSEPSSIDTDVIVLFIIILIIGAIIVVWALRGKDE
jgi:hypothetical protein